MEKPEENYALARWSKLATKVIKSWWQYIPLICDENGTLLLWFSSQKHSKPV